MAVAETEPYAGRFPATPDHVPLARHAVVKYLSDYATPDPPLSDVALAVSEGATNCVHHAYVDAPAPGEFRVSVSLFERELEVVIEDDGAGMIPRPDTPGLGLGLPLIATIAERFDARSDVGGGTRLCMVFLRDPGAATLD